MSMYVCEGEGGGGGEEEYDRLINIPWDIITERSKYLYSINLT